MALMINNNCISCNAYLPTRPNQASFENRGDAEADGYQVSPGQGYDGTTYVISSDRCTERIGHFEEPQCASGSPIGDCCTPDPFYPESKEMLLSRARRLHPHKDIRHEMAWQGVNRRAIDTDSGL